MNKFHAVLTYIIGLIMVSMPLSGQTTVTITTNKDCATSSAQPTTNLNSDALGVLYSSLENLYMASLIYTNISNIPSNAQIISAHLYLYCILESGGNVSLRIGRLASDSWTETGVTYNNMPYGTTPPPFKYFSVVPNMWNTYNVTEFVEAWHSGTYNNGFQLFTTTDGTLAMFYNSETGSSWAPYLSITYECPTPAIPSLYSPGNGSTCVAYSPTSFDWSSVSDATGYEIYISPGGTYTTTSSSYSKTLSPNTTYTWKVRAVNDCGDGSWSSSRTFTTTLTPGTPSLVSPSNGEENVNPNPVSFDWSSVSGAAQYEINISPGETYTASSSDYSQTLDECASYSWRVRAINNCDIGDWSVTWNFTTDCPQQLPMVITSAASNVSTTSATLNGTVNPNGASTNYYFEYGTSTSYGTKTSTKDAGSGTSNVSVSATVPELSPNTKYHFRLVASNSGGIKEGDDKTFTTSSEPVPTVVTGTASNVSASSATLNGTVNPNGSSTDYYFEYGTSTSYGTKTSTKDAGSGTSNVSVSAPVSGLSPNTKYHFQLVATNSGGTNNGNDQTFTPGTVAIDDQHYIPLSFELKAAYPNPFNPGTTIGFALPKATRITLVVYDIWGREVYRLVDGFFGPGNYKVEWRGIGENGQEYPSGIYIVRMITPEFAGSEKIVKMK